jgi:hypothetical protein
MVDSVHGLNTYKVLIDSGLQRLWFIFVNFEILEKCKKNEIFLKKMHFFLFSIKIFYVTISTRYIL